MFVCFNIQCSVASQTNHKRQLRINCGRPSGDASNSLVFVFFVFNSFLALVPLRISWLAFLALVLFLSALVFFYPIFFDYFSKINLLPAVNVKFLNATHQSSVANGSSMILALDHGINTCFYTREVSHDYWASCGKT